MSSFNRVGGRYGMHSGSGKFKNLQVTGSAWVNGMPLFPTYGDVWFVDNSVDSNGDGRSWATACNTITNGIAKASAGDTVLVRGTGTDYDESATIAYAKNGLTIQGVGNTKQCGWTSDADATGLTINAPGCTVRGMYFRMDGATSGAGILLAQNTDLTVDSSNAVIENCLFKSTGTTAYCGIRTGGADYVTIRNNMFTWCLTGIRGDGASGYHNSYCTNWQIHDNYFSDKCTNGIIIASRRSDIQNNVFSTMTICIDMEDTRTTTGFNEVHYNMFTQAYAATGMNAATDDDWLRNTAVSGTNVGIELWTTGVASD